MSLPACSRQASETKQSHPLQQGIASDKNASKKQPPYCHAGSIFFSVATEVPSKKIPPERHGSEFVVLPERVAREPCITRLLVQTGNDSFLL